MYWLTIADLAPWPGMWSISPASALLKEAGFPFPWRYQGQVASWLGVGVYVSLPLAGHLSGLKCACCHSLCVNSSTHQPCWVWRPPVALTVLLSLLPHRFLSLEGRDTHVPVRAECSTISNSQHAVHFWVCVLITIQYRRQLLCWRVCDTLMDSYGNMLLRVTLTQFLKTPRSFCLFMWVVSAYYKWKQKI